MEIYGTGDIARLITERTGIRCSQDKVAAALRKAGVGALKGKTRIVTSDELEKAIETVCNSRVGNPAIADMNKTLKPRKKR